MKVKSRVIIPRDRYHIVSVAELNGLGEIYIDKDFIFSYEEVFSLEDSIFIIIHRGRDCV